MPQMDPSVSVYPLSVFLVSFCEGQSVAVVHGVGASSVAEAPRSLGLQGYSLSHSAHGCRRRQCCRRPCHGKAVILLPPLVLVLLGLGSYLLLLNHSLTASGESDLLDLFRGKEVVKEEEDPIEDSVPTQTHITSGSITNTTQNASTVSMPVLAPATTPSLVPTSFIPRSTPPPFVTTALPSASGHARKCNETEKGYCVNNGECYFIHGINQLSCKCPSGYFGPRCLQPEPLRLLMPKPSEKSLGIEFMEAEELYHSRVLTMTCICVTLLVVGIVCVVAYCKAKKQRKKMHNHVRQNMCLDHPNRILANGPNHPGPGPEEIPMVDYISKNIPATERVMRSGAEASYAGSRHSSRSHNSSTRAHSSTQRHDERSWSMERTDSMLSDCPSGMLTSSVGTSKCSSPACMEARARRATHYGFTEPRRPPMRYGDSFDSLGDSPHSDRYVSALTTPARLSPADFHYSLPPQVPTFQITSPNASHAMSLPPATRALYPPEDQPLLRCYQLPLHEAQRNEPYQQQIQQQQRSRSYRQDSVGSLPTSPYRLAQDDDEYESTQEYPPTLEQPKKSHGRWHRSRLNGHVAPRGYRPARDLGSRSCLSDSESEGEEGERTPFLSMQNMNSPEPSAIYRPTPATHNTRTSHTQSRHTQQHARSKPDGGAH